jgi:hypothetical protein
MPNMTKGGTATGRDRRRAMTLPAQSGHEHHRRPVRPISMADAQVGLVRDQQERQPIMPTGRSASS